MDPAGHIERARRDPRHFESIAPREFEEVVAELLTNLGWDISLTGQTRDGGLDMLGISKDAAGFESTWGIECKRYRAGSPVGVAMVRELFGVKYALALSHAMLVTTSGVSRDAAKFAASSDIKIADLGVLSEWVASYNQKPRAEPKIGARFRSCFVSHSSSDREFVDQLVSALRAAGVRVWYAPDELTPGRKIQEDISEAIQAFDRLIVVLSADSIASQWVQSEIRGARRREIKENARILFPISLVPFDDLKSWELFDSDLGQDLAVEVREYFIPDFSHWTDPQAFEAGVEALLVGLKGL